MEENKDILTNNIKRTVLDYDDIRKMVPKLDGHEKLVNTLIHWLELDKVNDIHDRNCDHVGAPFTTALLKDLNITLNVDNEEILDRMQGQPFVTVSNHPFGALDGITLIHLVGSRNPNYKVMVNMILNYISAMRPNFIAVDALQSADPAKRAVSMKGIAAAVRQVKEGNPIGFFPAGAVSKVNIHGDLVDRQWQESVIRLIKKFNVPVVPIFFHGSNSWFFNFLGVVCWQLRTLRLPHEVFRRKNSTMHVSIGEPIMPEDYGKCADINALGEYLKAKTYELKTRYGK